MSIVPCVLSVLLLGAAPGDSGNEPVSDAAVREAISHSLPWLRAGADQWREDRKCVTCHRIAIDLWAENEALTRGFDLPRAAHDALTAWALEFCATDKSKEEFTGGFLNTMSQMILSQRGRPANKQAAETFEKFIPIFARIQRDDGSWHEGNQIKIEGADREADEVDTMWTLLAMAALEPAAQSFSADSRAALKRCQERALAWLGNTKAAARTDWLMLRMLLAKRYGPPDQVAELRQQLVDRQRFDGGWAFVADRPSHPHVTGECLFALAAVDVEPASAVVQRARTFLVAQQRADGSWLNPSRRKPERTYDITNYWGTGWATIGLLHALPK